MSPSKSAEVQTLAMDFADLLDRAAALGIAVDLSVSFPATGPDLGRVWLDTLNSRAPDTVDAVDLSIAGEPWLGGEG